MTSPLRPGTTLSMAPRPFGPRRAFVALLVAVLTGWLQVAQAGPDPFPRPATLEPNITFWTRVFAEWSQGQVALHDREWPALVYEVIDLPQPVGERLTEAQQAWIDAARDVWRERLRRTADQLEQGLPLSDDDKALALLVATTAGSDALEGVADRVRAQRGLRERFFAGLQRSGRWIDEMKTIFRDAGLPEDLAYLPHVESSFDPTARSSVGAAGMWQFTLGAAKRYLKVNRAVDERLDPIAATRGATRYLSDAWAQLGAWPLAITSYNHGVGGMARAKAEFGSDFDRIYREYRGRSFGFASKNFYAEFLAVRDIARNPERHFPQGVAYDAPVDHERIVLDSAAPLKTVARRLGLPAARLESLNPAWSTHARRGTVSLPAGIEVWLQRGTLARSTVLSADAAGVHVVRAGETLSAIASRYGMDLASLRAANQLPAGSSRIHPGQRLMVTSAAAAQDHHRAPAATAAATASHVVRRGDTLTRIAASYGIALVDLLTANDLAVDAVIHPGQALLLPVLP